MAETTAPMAQSIQSGLGWFLPSAREDMDTNNDGKVDLQEHLLGLHVLDSRQDPRAIEQRDHVFFNRAVVISWPFFSLYLFSQPWLANYTNNMWWNYSAAYGVFGDNGELEGTWKREGMCITPAHEIHCTDGQNFTELAMKHRGAPFGCGCGQGVFGEGLCPMTSYGYTLSDYVSTAPALGAMLGLGFFPLLGTWASTGIINKHCKPSWFMENLHFMSMLFFQLSYIAWGISSDCIFPLAHAVLTVAFLGGFLWHWVVSAFLCIAAEGIRALEAEIVLYVACMSIFIISVGAVPRVFLTINAVLQPWGYDPLPNWNRGLGSYAFWFAEAAGLSLTFGAYPLILIGHAILTGPRNVPEEFRLVYCRDRHTAVAATDDA
eukprot:TRINITY_DN17188_c0_g1_i1.p1 TRINITY_DN17188_c0_g1~~TRINITY_DN17188_c0_g1_i1.p1  ORF type:complete len:377 (+),score=42.54 TRINITY_DN17188_c0_g1_i1:80-1210(+)